MIDQAPKPFAPPQSPKPPKFRMARVIGALILRETGSRDSRASLGFLWQVIEPVVSIAILSVLFSMISRSPPLGTNFPLYYVTGVVPFHLYASIGRQVSGSMRFSRNLLGLPAVTVVDLIMARFLLSALTNICIFIAMLVWLNTAYDLHLRPDMGALMLGLVMAMILGRASPYCAMPTWPRPDTNDRVSAQACRSPRPKPKRRNCRRRSTP